MYTKFSELLRRPLPSKSESGYYTENADATDLKDDLENAANPDEKKVLSEEDEHNIDERIKRIATPMLLQDEIGSQDEVNMFKESVDTDIAVDEGFFTERTIVKFDKVARKNQLKKVAVFAIAKEANDHLYKKLVTLWKLERTIEKKLMAKYDSKANAKVKKYIQDAKKSKSGIIKKAIARVTGKK